MQRVCQGFCFISTSVTQEIECVLEEHSQCSSLFVIGKWIRFHAWQPADAGLVEIAGSHRL